MVDDLQSSEEVRGQRRCLLADAYLSSANLPICSRECLAAPHSCLRSLPGPLRLWCGTTHPCPLGPRPLATGQTARNANAARLPCSSCSGPLPRVTRRGRLNIRIAHYVLTPTPPSLLLLSSPPSVPSPLPLPSSPFQQAFVPDEVVRIIQPNVESVLGGKEYDQAKVPQWVNAICEGVVADLTALEKPFKYMVTCLIMQRNGAGVHTANSCFYDTGNDGMAQYKYPNDKNKDQKTMYCIVTVFGTLF